MYLMTSLRYKFKASRYSALLVRCCFRGLIAGVSRNSRWWPDGLRKTYKK